MFYILFDDYFVGLLLTLRQVIKIQIEREQDRQERYQAELQFDENSVGKSQEYQALKSIFNGLTNIPIQNFLYKDDLIL